MLLTNTGRRWSAAFFGAFALALASCVIPDNTVAPRAFAPTPRLGLLPDGGVVISQVYGGGGNASSAIRNDFIELYNNSTCVVDLAGWSVQYASATGSSWQVTNLRGSIAPGGYYLIKEARGAGGTQDLPTPDATDVTLVNGTESGGIPMSATAGKVALVNSTTPLTTTSATATGVVDFVGFGTTAGTFEGAVGPTPAPSNTISVLRKDGGRTDANDNRNDFVAGSGVPVPRNSATNALTPTGGCASGGGGGTTVGPITQVSISPKPTASVNNGGTITFTGAAADANNTPVATTFAWNSSDPSIATIGTDGKVTALKVGTTNITATANSIASAATVLTVNAVQGSITLTSYSGFSTGLPIGFQTQISVINSKDSNGATINNTNVVFVSADPLTLSVNASTGVVTALKPGSTKITVTAISDGTTASTTVTTGLPNAASFARAGHNTDLGIPTDADPTDDYIIKRKQYTLSYNPLRGGPNWVSWNLDASHKGTSSRCNCFTADPAVAAFNLQAYDTNDWVNNITVGGVTIGFSRGHMSPSADWADVEDDNSGTYYLSNMLPQNQILNGGVWGTLESDLRTKATGATEIYIIAGPVYTKGRSGSVDGLGYITSATGAKIVAPDSIWKIAIVVPDARDATSVAPTDVEVIATMFPNNATGTGSGSWNQPQFVTTIDKIQRSTGYNFLSLLPEPVQCKIEIRNCLPQPTLVSASGSANVILGTPFVLSTTATDADGSDGPWRYLLEWGDGTSFSSNLLSLPSSLRPLLRSKTYGAPGQYTIKLTITDKNGGKGVTTFVVNVDAPPTN